MEENEVNEVNEANESNVYSKVPVKAGFWTSFKNFWLQPITLELTPHQKKVFQEVRDFWNQEVYVEKGEIRLRKRADSIEEEPEVKVSL